MKERVDKPDFIKMKNFKSVKETVREWKDKSNWEKCFQKTYDKGIV